MRKIESEFFAFFVAVSALAVSVAAAEPVPLPGEDGGKAAISPAPFPDRMSAYVWRNWGLVEKERLAEVVGATAADMADVAVQMGLEPDPVVLPEWKTKGYITVVRRNWHLLPYDQLLKLLGIGMGRHLNCGGDFGAERRCFGELSKKQDGDMDNLKVGDSHRGRPILQKVHALCRFRSRLRGEVTEWLCHD